MLLYGYGCYYVKFVRVYYNNVPFFQKCDWGEASISSFGSNASLSVWNLKSSSKGFYQTTYHFLKWAFQTLEAHFGSAFADADPNMLLVFFIVEITILCVFIYIYIYIYIYILRKSYLKMKFNMEGLI